MKLKLKSTHILWQDNKIILKIVKRTFVTIHTEVYFEDSKDG